MSILNRPRGTFCPQTWGRVGMFLPTPKPSLGLFSTASVPTSLWQKCSGPQLVVPTEPGKAPGTDRVDQLNHISLSGELKLRVAVFLRVPDLPGGLWWGKKWSAVGMWKSTLTLHTGLLTAWRAHWEDTSCNPEGPLIPIQVCIDMWDRVLDQGTGDFSELLMSWLFLGFALPICKMRGWPRSLLRF